MKTKILAGVLLTTLATAGTLTYAASTTDTTNTTNNSKGMHQMEGKGHGGKMGGPGFMTKLTNDEKTKLEIMTDTEKKAFFEAKMTAEKTARDAKEIVIDKLINGETLSDSEKVTLETIKTERATAKAERAKMETERTVREAQMTEIKAILAKVKAGTTLTSDEQTKLNTFKADMPEGGRSGKPSNITE